MKTTNQNKATQTLAVSGCVDNPLLNGLSFVAIDDDIVNQLAKESHNFTQTKVNKHTQKQAKKHANFHRTKARDWVYNAHSLKTWLYPTSESWIFCTSFVAVRPTACAVSSMAGVLGIRKNPADHVGESTTATFLGDTLFLSKHGGIMPKSNERTAQTSSIATNKAEFSEPIKKDENQAETLPHHPTTYRVKLSLDGIERDGIHFAESQYLGDYDTSEEARAAAIQGIDTTDNAHGAIIDTITWCAATPYRGMVIFMDKPPFVIGCYERIKQAEGVVKRAYDGLKARGAIDWYIEALDGMDSESAVCDGV